MAEFDRFSHDYRERLNDSLGGLGSIDSALGSKLGQLDRVFARAGTGKLERILDFGTGTGLLAGQLGRYAEQVIGLDVSLDSLRQSGSPDSFRIAFDGVRIPLSSDSVDAAVASCVFHHITAGQRPAVMAELGRVLRPGGCMVIIEHNPFNPVTRWVVNRCEFDRNAELLTLHETRRLFRDSGFESISQGYYYAIPPVNRPLAAMDSYLKSLPLGAQYHCAARVPLSVG